MKNSGNNDDFAARIKKIRENLGLKQKDFAERLKISGPALSEIEKGKYKPGHDFYVNISTEFKVNLYYLLMGQGEMFLDPHNVYIGSLSRLSVDNEEMGKMLWFLERSKMVQYLMLAHFRSILHNEKAAIEKDVEEYEASGTE